MISPNAQQTVSQLVTAGGIALATCVCWQARLSWNRLQRLPDLSALVLASVWLGYLVITIALKATIESKLVSPISWLAWQDYVDHIGLQLLVISVGYFLLLTASVPYRWVYILLLLQFVTGLAVLSWRPWSISQTFVGFSASGTHHAWIIFNSAGAIVMTGMILFAAGRSRSTAGWLAFNGCLIGLALCADQLLVGDRSIRTGQVSQLAYALFLWVVWQISSDRFTGQSQSSLLSSAEFPQSEHMVPLSDFGGPLDAVAAAVAAERQRIGKDLHDGLASHLVLMLATLDCAMPRDQRMALALEQCLVELKLTVDALDSGTGNILDALGRLRYRVQHSLDKLGIRMSWRVEVRDELTAITGEAALQALRIAQEGLANVMVHAHASAVEVVCRYVTETRTMVLEVRDNGRGIPRRLNDRPSHASHVSNCTERGAGKGLINMRSRAKSIGGQLTIASKLGAGTRVRLELPVPLKAADAFEANLSTLGRSAQAVLHC